MTETGQGTTGIMLILTFSEHVLITSGYLALALFVSPLLTVVSLVVLGTIALLFKFVLEPAYEVGDRQAKANERIQEIAQEVTRGLPEVKTFGLAGTMRERFLGYVRLRAASKIRIDRNKKAISNLYSMVTGLVLFGLIYLGFVVSSLSLASLGLFIIAMYRLAPRVSQLANLLYSADGRLPHLVRTFTLIDELEANREPDTDAVEVPSPVETVQFDDVSFAYDDEVVLSEVSLRVARGEFVALAGPSGAGKSTVASLLTRLYEPDSGRIYADGEPIDQMPLADWRDRLTFVRQQPHLFNATLRENITIGDSEATTEEIQWACDIAQIDEFLSELPAGLDTELGKTVSASRAANANASRSHGRSSTMQMYSSSMRQRAISTASLRRGSRRDWKRWITISRYSPSHTGSRRSETPTGSTSSKTGVSSSPAITSG
ncbi:ABC transporter ATP-binding protein [Haloarculaceae archaeon H-GB2-1]|nr:ABC transporter ATP-binding protein [Haloarculaceae archaeon H-GB11]MEA5406484.1 ABC transporter ATP-binding protein [Haloarculaceae archaeon H-GB2-1]